VHCVAFGAAAAARAEGAGVTASDDGVIENEHVRVEVALDGSFVVVDKASGKRSGTQNLLVDDGDRGDEYTYSYAGPTVGSRGVAGARRAAVTGDRAMCEVDIPLRLPTSLRADRLARTPDTRDCAVKMAIAVDAGARRVDVTLTIDNQARDHRLRVLCDTDTRSLSHIAGTTFAWIDRHNRVSGKRGWIEQPTPERCAHDLVAIDGALAVGLDGLREYAVLHDGRTIAITLLRAMGWLSRGDMAERRGHAGPALETPSAQMIGTRTYRYCVVPMFGDMTLAAAAREVREFLTPARVVLGARATGPFMELPRDSIVQPSALRAARGGIAVRLFNPRGTEESIEVRFHRPIASARAVDLREGDLSLGNTGFEVLRTAAPPQIAGPAMTVRLAAYEIGTYLLTFV
jgi:alpha-mannosidase